MSQNIFTASRQWASRPDDQRFLTLEELRESVAQRRRESWTTQHAMTDLRTIATDDDDILLTVLDQPRGREVTLRPTNWSFGQMCQRAGAPTSYLKTLPAQLAAINLQWGFEHCERTGDDGLILAHENGDRTLTSITGTAYGRIWDEQVVDAVIKANPDGQWKVPAASYATSDPKRATTLYASDRDVFLFMVDESRPIERGNEQLFRGFMVWNSEVGSSAFGLQTFLYRYVCDNRIIWGATNVDEIRIRHTGGAPDRFASEGATFLRRYANESTALIEGHLKRAQEHEVAKDAKGIEDWLRNRGFTQKMAVAARAKAEEETGNPRSLWNIIQGVTAEARSVLHTDTRVDLERKAGDLMKYAAV